MLSLIHIIAYNKKLKFDSDIDKEKVAAQVAYAQAFYEIKSGVGD